MRQVRLHRVQAQAIAGATIAAKKAKIKKRSSKKPKAERKSIRYASYFITLLLIGLLILTVVLYDTNTITGPILEADSSIALSLFFPSVVFSYLLIKGNTISGIVKMLGLSKDKLYLRAIAIGIGLFFAVVLLDLLLGLFSAATNIPLPTNVQTLLAGTPLYFLVFTFLIAPINEEILFRGFLVPRIGIVLSAIIFAVLHLSYLSISEFLAAFFFALLAGYVFKRTKSLYPSIVAHMLVNAVTVISLIYVGGLFIHL
jgi:uncharacterized protein